MSVGLGWYFNIQYVAEFGARASWIHFTKSLFSNWAADSAAQDYIIANVVLFPLWTIVDGRRRGIRVPWGFFVISLFTSFALRDGRLPRRGRAPGALQPGRSRPRPTPTAPPDPAASSTA